MAARAFGLLGVEHNVLISERIHTGAVSLLLAVTRTSVRWPTPRVTMFVVYGLTGTKSLAMIVISWLSIVNL